MTTTCFRARPARTRPSAARTASPSRAACTRRRPRWTVRTSYAISIDIQVQQRQDAGGAPRARREGHQRRRAAPPSSWTAAPEKIYAAATLPYLNPADMSTVEEGADQVEGRHAGLRARLGVQDGLHHDASGDGFHEARRARRSARRSSRPTATRCRTRTNATTPTFTLREILDQSSNAGISLSVEKMGCDKLLRPHQTTYNLNEPTGVDYPGEASGARCEPFDKWARITGYDVASARASPSRRCRSRASTAPW